MMHYAVQIHTGLAAVPATADIADRTVELTSDLDHRVRWTLALDWVRASAVTLQAYASVDGGVTWGLIQSQTLDDGTATLNDYTQSKATSGDVSVDGWVDTFGTTKIKLVVSATGGGALDLITLTVASARYR